MTKIRDKKLLVQFGKSLRRRRIEKELSQENLANDADIPRQQISRIERGEINPSLSTLYSIAKALKMRLSQLFEEV